MSTLWKNCVTIFFYNLYLIDDTVMNERLCLWLQDELNLPGLAARLRANLGKFSSLEDVLYPVFKEINYLTYEELKVLKHTRAIAPRSKQSPGRFTICVVGYGL